jgi:4-hydroxy-tetrahydrodipicolinate synthase
MTNANNQSTSTAPGPDPRPQTHGPFCGLWLPLITPFRNNAVDHPALARLVRHYCSTGIAGLVACGSTGEAAALDDAEQLAVLDTVIDALEKAGSALPVVMGLSGYNLRQTLAWVKVISGYPVAGLLVPAPHYIRPSQAGLLHWFNEIADASSTPLIVYDIPQRTGVSIDVKTMLQLAGHRNILGVKDCGQSAVKTHALIADGRLAVLAGDDLQLFNTLALGGAGSITASAHIHTERFVGVIRLLQEGSLHGARAAWMPLVPVIDAMFAEPNPASIKAALARDGWIANELRAPMMRAA